MNEEEEEAAASPMMWLLLLLYCTVLYSFLPALMASSAGPLVCTVSAAACCTPFEAMAMVCCIA
jgi:hypothetical protein